MQFPFLRKNGYYPLRSAHQLAPRNLLRQKSYVVAATTVNTITVEEQTKQFLYSFEEHLASVLGGQMSPKAAVTVVTRVARYILWSTKRNTMWESSKIMYEVLIQILKAKYYRIPRFARHVENKMACKPSTVAAYLDAIMAVTKWLAMYKTRIFDQGIG
jgi:hypothetical protein